ncbi:LOW QUALITY PROTEIN: QWRF motif-containing protein 3 [Solanum pennellii]|uniref:LOW QUALITY PROTEIN: QWRF motif-containing protein 3 n=1 Tax=Solanum pennellii TaxID=28526 RepID=A0ABM1H894_SOLPN|nr:LOW QUALITY PROTEIN: QWRF motif-containing protein 3 [Solanum pennellii]
MKENYENVGFGDSLKPKKSKSREVSSRYLSPTSNSSIIDDKNQSPESIVSKTRSSTDYNKHKSLEKSGLLGKLWPSSSSPSSIMDTFGNHLGNERLKDVEERKDLENSNSNSHPLFLSKQKSCTGFSRFENEKERTKEKEKRRSFFGGSGKIKFPGKFSNNSSKSSNLSDGSTGQIASGRFSVDANSLGRRCNSARIRSDILSDIIANESESEYSDICSNNSFDSPVFGYMAPTISSRKSGIEVPSKYMQDTLSKSRRWSSDCTVPKPESPKLGLKFKNPIQKAATSLNSKTSKWAWSPGRPNSPPVLIENRGIFTSNMKPPTSPSKGKSVGNFLSMGLELLKGKKFSSGAASPLRPGTTESVHRLKILHNKLLQWRYVNARADSVHHNISKQAETNLVYAWDGLIKMRQSVVQKKLQLRRQNLEMKLSFVLRSQIKLLEGWGSIERQHSSAVSNSVDCLQSALCRVPLIEGATVEPQSAIIALQHASDVSTSITLRLSNFSSGAEKTAEVMKEMAEIVVQEKLLLEECLELFKNISTLESQERYLICSIIQLRQQLQKEKRMVYV